MSNIVILAMKTWGELGNLLAAQTLSSTLTKACSLSPTVMEAEKLFPRFAQIGDQISVISKIQDQPQGRYSRYMGMMERVSSVFYPGFENDEHIRGPVADEISRLRDFLGDTKPDLVIGTKGVISRLCMAALHQAHHRCRLVNFVTNEGLLTIPIHRSILVPHHLVPFESGRQYLIQYHGYRAEQVRTVGRVIAFSEIPKFVERGSSSADSKFFYPEGTRVRALVFSNRGGQAYLKILQCLAAHGLDVGVVFIGYNDEQLVTSAEELKREKGLSHWCVVNRLDQGNYIKCIRWLSESDYPLLISKTGPNTMLEAAYFGVAQLLLNSGLPMEQWVIPFLEQHRMGMGFDDADKLVTNLDNWLRCLPEITSRKLAAKHFSETLMDQQQVAKAIGGVFTEILQSPPHAF